jgi:hypothetical protein
MYNYSEYIKNNCEFLQRLAKTRSDSKKQKYISLADRDKLLAIVEICTNILKANFPLKQSQRKKLARNADYYRKISRARTEKSARHRIQTGGSAIALAAVLAPVLGSVAQYILDKTLLKEQ